MKRSALLWVLGVLAVLLAAPLLGEPLGGPHRDFVLLQLRLPRVMMGTLVGATLGLAGASHQLVFRNPLATPSTTGTIAGAVLGALAAVVLGASGSGGGLPLLVLAAFAGALGASLVVAGLAASGRARMEDVLLAGIAVSLAAGAIASALESAADLAARFAVSQWSLGHLPQVGFHGAIVLAPFVLTSWVVTLALLRSLETLAEGEALAHARGVSVARVRALALGASALGVAACVAWCGPISFVGLIVPHLVRLTVGHSPRALLPLSALGGAGFLVLCDALARLLLPGREIPVGVVTAGLGAPALLWLLVRRRAG